MARATRSTVAAEPPTVVQKKRKRTASNADQLPSNTKTPRLDAPEPTLDPGSASQILHVLTTHDPQGLLDRVFPLALRPETPPVSLRAILEHPAQHPLSVINAALNHLRPISSLPRSRPSPAADQQRRFCSLAQSLLAQAFRTSASVPLTIDSLIPHDEQPGSPPSSKSPRQSHPSARSPLRRHALVQHLPAGDYWSSIATDPIDPTLLSVGNAELAVVLPTPSSSSTASVPTLASYHSRPIPPRKALPSQRHLSAGCFLDYGIHSSFAPTFDQEMQLVGRRALGEVLYQKETRAKAAEAARLDAESTASIVEVHADVENESVPQEDTSPPPEEPELVGLLPEEDIEAIKSALGNLQLERSVQALLDKNARALQRLEELQVQRLVKDGASNAQEGSEEWDTAQSIADSLTLLASMRPRSATGTVQSIIPPPSVLRKLHRTLALGPTPGWYGTLPPDRPTALKDDSTVKARSGVVPSSTPGTPAPASLAPAATPAAAPPYANYNYNYAANSQQPAAVQPYRPQSALAPAYKPPYYQGYVTPASQQQSGYYAQQSYAGASPQTFVTTNQQPYSAYSSWYTTTQYAQQAASSGTASGPGTPQPSQPSYGNFFSNPASAAVRTPAVANTVLANKGAPITPVQQPGSLATPYAQPIQQQNAIPTLPAHLRTQANVGTAPLAVATGGQSYSR